MHCTARNNIAHYFFDKLKEGGIYLLKGFTVQNTDQYRILKDTPFVIGLNGSTIVKKVDDASGSFTRYPFLLTAFEDLQPTEGKFFVDVVGYVTDVGPQSVKATGARTVEFNLTNERKRGVRVTLWGQLGDAMLKKKEQNPAVYSIILTSMSAKFHLGALGLSSSSSTMIIDSPRCPPSKLSRHPLGTAEYPTMIPSCVAIGDTSDPITEDVVCVGTLQELVDRVRADKSKKKVILFRNVVEIMSIRTKNSWYLFACSGSKCRKGMTREDSYFICKACESKVDYPRTRFRIQADVTDETMSTVVVLFDEAAEQLVKRTAKSLVEEQLKIVGPGMDDADMSVDTVAIGLGATPSGSLKRGSNLPPLTPVTGRKLRKFCVEDSDEDDDGVRVDRKDVTDVLDDGRDDEEGSC
ncbi:replication protein A 70 kDa DNA-binding subunit-like [Helianthus annuus]|uniref:replication protein A 70 kDa DNA-binding subunit-like n=1 Tax=Helianthus annuus TaxID=4232 RepID=UPI0016532B40|nr:replication protein A 70 kDa DNA-binding subunit-like [Helianthus annuus]